MLFLDLNNFKQVNDLYGHSEGDNLLRKIAKAIKENVRQTDFVIRYGGDEFIIVTDAGPDTILKLIERLHNSLKFTYRDIDISVAIGSACYPIDGKNLEELIKVADERMCELPLVIDPRLRVGLHRQRGALPPQAGSLRLSYSCLYPHTGV